jgi:hypothetical protein
MAKSPNSASDVACPFPTKAFSKKYAHPEDFGPAYPLGDGNKADIASSQPPNNDAWTMLDG